MARCSVEVSDTRTDDKMPALFGDIEAEVPALIEGIIKAIGAEVEFGPHLFQTETTTWYFVGLSTIGWLVFVGCPNEPWFSIDIKIDSAVEKRRVMSIVDKHLKQYHLILAKG